MRPLVYAHRGGAGLTPENTMTAFDRGLAHGADGLEFDVHLSKDGVPVIIHDPTVDRTTDGAGAVAELTAAELAALDAGHHFDPDAGFPWRGRVGGVPALIDVLARHTRVPLIIELKTAEPALAQTVIDMVRAAGLTDHVTIGSFLQGALDAVRNYAPEFRTGADVDEIKGGLAATLFDDAAGPLPFHAFQVPEIFAGQRIVTPEFVARARAAGAGFTVWIINDAEHVRRLLEWGVDGIITDRPDIAVPTVHEWWAARSAELTWQRRK
jgi:glycerophosphoryl diester phosphodiesterase